MHRVASRRTASHPATLRRAPHEMPRQPSGPGGPTAYASWTVGGSISHPQETFTFQGCATARHALPRSARDRLGPRPCGHRLRHRKRDPSPVVLKGTIRNAVKPGWREGGGDEGWVDYRHRDDAMATVGGGGGTERRTALPMAIRVIVFMVVWNCILLQRPSSMPCSRAPQISRYKGQPVRPAVGLHRPRRETAGRSARAGDRGSMRI